MSRPPSILPKAHLLRLSLGLSTALFILGTLQGCGKKLTSDTPILSSAVHKLYSVPSPATRETLKKEAEVAFKKRQSLQKDQRK